MRKITTILGIASMLLIAAAPALADVVATPLSASSVNSILVTETDPDLTFCNLNNCEAYFFDGSGNIMGGNDPYGNTWGGDPSNTPLGSFYSGGGNDPGDFIPGSYTVIFDEATSCADNSDTNLTDCLASVSGDTFFEFSFTITSPAAFSPAVGAIGISSSTQPALLASIGNAFKDPGMDALIVMMLGIDIFFWFIHKTKRIVPGAAGAGSYDKEIGILNKAELQSHIINARAERDLSEIEGIRRRSGGRRRHHDDREIDKGR